MGTHIGWKSAERDSGMGSQEVWGCPTSFVKVASLISYPISEMKKRIPVVPTYIGFSGQEKARACPLWQIWAEIPHQLGVTVHKVFSTLLGPHSSSGCQHVYFLSSLSSLWSLSPFRFSLSSIGLWVVLGL